MPLAEREALARKIRDSGIERGVADSPWGSHSFRRL
jgi:hypothetical protein